MTLASTAMDVGFGESLAARPGPRGFCAAVHFFDPHGRAAFAERAGQRIHVVQRFENQPVPLDRLAEHHAGAQLERPHRLGCERGLKGG